MSEKWGLRIDIRDHMHSNTLGTGERLACAASRPASVHISHRHSTIPPLVFSGSPLNPSTLTFRSTSSSFSGEASFIRWPSRPDSPGGSESGSDASGLHIRANADRRRPVLDRHALRHPLAPPQPRPGCRQRAVARPRPGRQSDASPQRLEPSSTRPTVADRDRVVAIPAGQQQSVLV